MLKTLNDQQAARYAAALAYEHGRREAQGQPRFVELYLSPEAPDYPEWAARLAEAEVFPGHLVGRWQITEGILQDEIDRAVTDDDVRTFLAGLPWEALTLEEHEGLGAWLWNRFYPFLEQRGYRAPLESSKLHTHPYFMLEGVAAGDNVRRLRHGRMLVDKLSELGLLERILPPTPEQLRDRALASGLTPVVAFHCEECGLPLRHETEHGQRVRFDSSKHAVFDTADVPWEQHRC